MHELSLAAAIVEIAAAHAGGRRVTGVHVRVGHLRQVVPSALTFGFELVAQGTAAEGARLEIESVPVEALCRRCGADARPTEFPLLCGRCGSAELEILAGEELRVESLEIEEPEEAAHVSGASGLEDGGREGDPRRE